MKTKQEKEIERLKAAFKQLETNAEILARGVRDLNHENYELTDKVKQARKETAIEILDMLYDMGVDKEMCEYCRTFDVNGVSLAEQICEKYGVDMWI